jgi:hypothetical protein
LKVGVRAEIRVRIRADYFSGHEYPLEQRSMGVIWRKLGQGAVAFPFPEV